MAIKINEIKQTQALTATDETKDTSHLVNANKKLKTPLTSKNMSHLGRLYMTLFDRLEPPHTIDWNLPSIISFSIQGWLLGTTITSLRSLYVTYIPLWHTSTSLWDTSAPADFYAIPHFVSFSASCLPTSQMIGMMCDLRDAMHGKSFWRGQA